MRPLQFAIIHFPYLDCNYISTASVCGVYISQLISYNSQFVFVSSCHSKRRYWQLDYGSKLTIVSLNYVIRLPCVLSNISRIVGAFDSL